MSTSMEHDQKSTPHVVIAGGGVAGLEAVIARCSLAGEHLRITLLDPADDFIYRPMSVGAPFAAHGADRTPLDKIARDFSADRVKDSLDRVDPSARRIVTGSGQEIEYDTLLVTLGAHRSPAFAKATTFRHQEDAEAVHGLVQDMEGGYIKRVAFVVPGGVTWPLPLYELALMTALRASEMS